MFFFIFGYFKTIAMKKTLLVLSSLVISVYSFGQFSLGVKAGLNVNDMILKDAPPGDDGGIEANIGFHAGVYTTININKKFSFIPELQFSQRGYASKSSFGDARVNLNYLELPLLLSYSPIEFLNIDLGPNFAYKLSAVSKSDGTSRNIDNVFEEDLDIGITGGLRFNVSEKISIVGRYYYGITSLFEFSILDDQNNPLGSGTAHNRNIQVGLSYKIK
jgi:hypothetical protein